MDGAYLFNTLLFFAIYAILVFFAARAISKGKKARILKFFAIFSVLMTMFGVINTLASMGIEIAAIFIWFLGLPLMALTPVITNEIAIRLPKKPKSEEEKETVEHHDFSKKAIIFLEQDSLPFSKMNQYPLLKEWTIEYVRRNRESVNNEISAESKNGNDVNMERVISLMLNFICDSKLGSGTLHIYRGVLSPLGKDLLTLNDAICDFMYENDYTSEEDYHNRKTMVRDDIRNAG